MEITEGKLNEEYLFLLTRAIDEPDRYPNFLHQHRGVLRKLIAAYRAKRERVVELEKLVDKQFDGFSMVTDTIQRKL